MFIRKKALERMHAEWIKDIAAVASREETLRHMIHHVEEALQDSPDQSWLASMTNLIEILCLIEDLDEPSVRTKLARLYLHWQQDPAKTVPPPQFRSLKRASADIIAELDSYREDTRSS